MVERSCDAATPLRSKIVTIIISEAAAASPDINLAGFLPANESTINDTIIATAAPLKNVKSMPKKMSNEHIIENARRFFVAV